MASKKETVYEVTIDDIMGVCEEYYDAVTALVKQGLSVEKAKNITSTLTAQLIKIIELAEDGEDD